MSDSNTQPASDRSNTANQRYKTSLLDNNISPLVSKAESSISFKLRSNQELDNEIDNGESSFNDLAKTLDTNYIKMKLVKVEELLGKIDKDLVKQSCYIEIIGQLKSMVDYLNEERVKQQNLGIKLEHLMENQFMYLTRYFEENNFEIFDARVNQLEQKIENLTVMFNQNLPGIGPPRINYNSTFSQLHNPRWPNVSTSMMNSDANNINSNSEMLDYKLRELKRSYPDISKLNSIYQHPEEYPEFEEYPKNAQRFYNQSDCNAKRKTEAPKLMTEPPKKFNPRLLNENFSPIEKEPENQAQLKKRGRKKASEKK